MDGEVLDRMIAAAADMSPRERVYTLPRALPEFTLGWGVLAWVTDNLRQPNGPNAGQRFRCTEGQVRFLLHFYAVDADGRWLYNRAVRRLAKGSGKSPFAAVLALAELLGPVRLSHFDPAMPGGVVGKPVTMPLVQIAATSERQTANTMRMVRAMANKRTPLAKKYDLDPGKTFIETPNGGKLENITSSAGTAEGAEGSFVVGDEALDLATPLPTPSGWTTVEDVQVGDRLFGSNGPVTVTHVTPVFTGRPCFRVEFQDGTSLVADEGHLWASKVVASAAQERVRTTRQMFEDGRRFSVPKPAAVDGPAVELGMDPYVLGLWLGDGSSRWASLTVGDEDLDHVMGEVQRRGVPAAKATRYGERATTVSLQGNAQGDRYTKDGSSVRGALVRLGVLGNKHVPSVALRGSLSQRLDLLRGLMDSDGSVNAKGSAVFVNSNVALVEGVTELVRSLGYTASVTSRADDRWAGSPVVYKVAFRPEADRNPFLMPRKADRVRGASLRRHKTITAIVPVESVPVKCIEVDSEDHLFVAGDGWTLTHNTEHWTPGVGGPALAETLDQNLAKTGSRMLETSNAWIPGADSVAESTFEAWCEQEEGNTRGTQKVLYDAIVAPPNTVLHDDVEDGEVSLTTALEFVYQDCPWVDIVPIQQKIWAPNYPVSRSRRFFLNQPNAAEDSWVTLQEWSVLAEPGRELVDGEDVVLFFDGSKSNDHTALVGCCMSDGHVFTVGVWAPEERTGVVNTARVDSAVHATMERFTVVAFWADVREWESYVKDAWPEAFKDDLMLWAVPTGREPAPIAWDMRSHSYQFAEAAEMVRAEIEDGGFTHDGNWDTSRHMGNARMAEFRGRITVKKESPKSPNKIDAAVCVIGARMVYRRVLASPEWEARSRRSSFVFYT